MKSSLRLFDADLGGHRHGYMEYFAAEFTGMQPERVVGKRIGSWLSLVFSPEALLISADHYTIFAGSVGMARRLLGKKTTAIYIAPHILRAERGRGPAIKGAILRFAKKLNFLNGYAITPFDLEPMLRDSCQGWIHDIQFCAANSVEATTFPEAEEELTVWMDGMKKNGNTLIVQLGGLILARGSGELVKIPDDDLLRAHWAVLMAGTMEQQMKDLPARPSASPLRLYDGLISEKTFVECLKKADLVWCYYPPHYNQSSGLFCNALIHGKQVIVREGSFVDRLGRAHFKMTPVIGTEQLPIPPDALILQPSNPEEVLQLVKDHNHRVLHAAMEGSGRH